MNSHVEVEGRLQTRYRVCSHIFGRTKNTCAVAMTMRGWRPSSKGCSASSPRLSPCSILTILMTPSYNVMLSVSFDTWWRGEGWNPVR
jgi:hypothetical protein